MTNLYDILNIEKTANSNEIKKAYRNLAKKYHPDINKEEYAEDFFKKINYAYEILNNKEKKYNYDNMSNEKFKTYEKTKYKRSTDKQKKENIDDLFDDTNIDINIDIEIPIEKSINGGIIEIKLFGKPIKIKINKNTNMNDIIIIKKKGNKNKHKQGDLILHVKIVGSKTIHIKNLNIYQNINIKLNTAIFGKIITVDTVIGEQTIHIEEGTQFNDKFIIKNKGIRNNDTGEQGDLILIFKIDIPFGSKLNTTEQSLYKTQKKLQNKMKFISFTKTLYKEIKTIIKENNYFETKFNNLKENLKIIHNYKKENLKLKIKRKQENIILKIKEMSIIIKIVDLIEKIRNK